jgi:glycosyltransferase involved in cell wall biosynthesis
MEAMACELPVISTPVAGIPELIQPGKTGLMVKSRDALGLAAALEQLILDRVARHQLGKAARQKIVNEFESQQNVAKLASILRRISKHGQENRLKPLVDGQHLVNL